MELASAAKLCILIYCVCPDTDAGYIGDTRVSVHTCGFNGLFIHDLVVPSNLRLAFDFVIIVHNWVQKEFMFT